MTPLERLLAEAIPDGTFGGARPAPAERRKDPAGPAERPPDPDAAEHQRRLLAGLAEARRPVKAARHLTVVPPQSAAA